MIDIPAKPKWLTDYPEIESCLHAFINKLDKQAAKDRKFNKIPYAINRENFPSLWEQNAASDVQWQCILLLKQEYSIAEIKLNKKLSPYDPEFQQASIQLYCSAENVVRQWLKRPYEAPLLTQWRTVIRQNISLFPGSTERLQARIFSVPGKSNSEVVDAFRKVGEYQQKALTLRQLSACCFWGMSKILDDQEALVLALYPQMKIQPRSLIVNLHTPAHAKKCLFIENYDTYMTALQGKLSLSEQYILVYCSGFLGSASRIRTLRSFVFHGSSSSCLSVMKAFEDWWLGNTTDNLAVYFWGDLDFSGMAILAALRNVFPEIEAWQPAYEEMLVALETGQAHEPDISGKTKQEDPEVTGCEYADRVLLPALRVSGLFVDQEIVC